MTHPGVEEVADHLEGLLEAEHDQRVRTHLEQCAACAAVARDLAAAADVLRAAAADPPPMPAPLAQRVDEAIAAESRQRAAEPGTPVTALADRRTRRRRRLAGGLLAAAAATVVGVAIGEMQPLDGAGGDAATQAESGVAAEQRAPRASTPQSDQAFRGGQGQQDALRDGPPAAAARKPDAAQDSGERKALRALGPSRNPADLVERVADALARQARAAAGRAADR